MKDVFIAHVRKAKDGSSEVHNLFEHLEGTSKLAKEFAASFGSDDWAELAASWHDLGKFLPAWQVYIRRKTGFDSEAHIEGYSGRPNHSTAGAVLAFERFNATPLAKIIAKIIAYIIAGHHAGLPDWMPESVGGDLQNRLYDVVHNKLKNEDLNEIRQALASYGREDLLVKSLPHSIPKVASDAEHWHLWIRMLFSCVVDADFLDTASFMNFSEGKKQYLCPDLQEVLSRFNVYMERKNLAAVKSPLNSVRAEILNACRQKSRMSPGFYTLTVPTGGGKTLASMAFALEHALTHNKKRIVMAIPYTSIIEQTAAVYREALGPDSVVEHHSGLDPDKESSQNRLASENWDSSVIVTTNVQLFESLLASRGSSCRKLHNLVNSVIILDEAQMLPIEYLKPILSVLRGLVKHFGVTIVLCSATQPALNGMIGSGESVFEGLPTAIDIVENLTAFDNVFSRYEVEWPNLSCSRQWDDVSGELAQLSQVLCIVNTRKDCHDLHKLLPAGGFHLSANLCGAHRSCVIAEIKSRLLQGDDVRVVSTQLIEAGVDIDFPVVYRALAGIDSIAQAAGRCNREGSLIQKGKKGKVIVFVPPSQSPVGLLRKGEDAARSLICSGSVGVFDTHLYSQYFKAFFQSANNFDKPAFNDRMVKGTRDLAFQFRSFAQDVRLVDDRGQRSVIVFYKNTECSSFEWIDQLRRNGPERWLLRKLQRFIVNVPLPVLNKLECDEHIENIHGYYVQKSTALYNVTYGLLSSPDLWSLDNFYV